MGDGALLADVGQLLWIGFRGTEAPEYIRAAIAGGRVGAAVLFRRNLVLDAQTLAYAGAAPDVGGNPDLIEQASAGAVAGGRVPAVTGSREVVDVDALAALIDGLRSAVPPDGQPILIAVDQEGGRVQRVRAPATRWPPMFALERFDDATAIELAREVGAAMGTELAALGFDIDFAPVLDVHTNPANPIIGDRSFSTDPERAAARALAFADGLHAAGVLSCGKHFPGHGDTHLDSHLVLPRVDHPRERLDRVELLPFRRAAAASLPMLMTAHVVFSAIDSAPATLSSALIDGVLRRELGYRGVVVSDDLDMKAIADNYGAAEAALGAVRAGCDALLLCCDPRAQVTAYEALVRAGEGDSGLRARIGEAADRVRALKRAHAARELVPAPRSVLGSLGYQQLAARLAGAAIDG
ncbi:MAG TPA: beta-N-acetylhexosaminidase [Kofleriaceae bacterium]|nr:beta-N-acetylhexosaminidase [Kofleriaceae bacterium]